MKSKITLFFAFLAVLTLAPFFAGATTRTVPGMFATIQGAIGASANGDSVIVSPGLYIENINFLGKDIVVVSTFFSTGNFADISNTIIDGNNAGTVARFATGEPATAHLGGFTIRRGLISTLGAFGGGIFIDGASPMLSYLIIENNLAILTGSGGGGVFIRNSTTDMHHCIVRNNRAFRGGGISIWENASPKIEDCLIQSNIATEFGGGAEIRFHNHPNLRFVNCTFVNNRASALAVNGGGAFAMRNNGAQVNVQNCILWGNTNPAISAITGNAQILSVSYSDVQGGQSGQQLQSSPNLTTIWGPGNIDQDPLFFNPVTNFRLTPASPCIETGNNGAVTYPLDLANFPRIFDADNSGTATVDMGAYEADFGFCPITTIPSSLASVQLTTRMCEGQITVCGDQAYVRTRVFNNLPVALDSLIFTPSLPPGVTYVPGSFSIDVVQPSAVQSTNPPKFAVYFPTGFQPGRFFTVTYAVRAGCDLIPFVQNGNPFILPMTLTYRESVSGNYGIQAEVNPVSFNVRFADLVITNVSPQVKIGNVGDQFVRAITILNGGNGSLDVFQLRDSSDNGITIVGIGKPAGNGGAIMGNDVTVTLDSADFLNNPHSSSNGDDQFDTNEYIVIYDTVRILPTCDTAETKFTASWGCNSENCTAQGDFEFANTILGQGGPNFQVTEIPTYIPTNYCSGDTGRITFRFRNIGPEQFPGAARAMNVQVVFTSTYNPSSLINFRIGSFSLAAITTPAVQGSTHTINFTNLTVDPDGPGGLQDLDGDGRYDDMLKNAFIDITADILMNCPANFNSCQANFNHTIAYPRISYYNQCYRFMGTRYGPARGVAGGTDCIPTTSGPTELGDGQIGTYTFLHDYPMGGLGNLDCNNRRPRLIATLPAGLNLVPGSPMVNNHAASYTLTGNQLVIIGDSLGAGGPILDDINGQLFTVQLEMDCNDSNLQAVSVLSWKQVYQCDTTCGCITGAGCASINIRNLCVCDAPLVTTRSFDAERTTFGWTDSHRNVFVNRNTPGIRLDRVYECDSIQAVARGVVIGAGADSVGVVIHYGTPGNDTLLIPGSAYVVTVDSITGLRDTCSVTGVVTQVSVSPYAYEVDYAAFGCGSPLTQGDSIILVANFDVKKTATLPIQSNYEIPLFHATHYTIENGQQRTCDSRGKRMYVLKSEVTAAMNTDAAHTFVASCRTIERRLEFRADGGACETDEFPNEFRNLYHIQDTVIFTLPNGYDYVPGSSRFTRETGDTTVYIIPNPIIAGNTLTYIASNYAIFSDNRWPLQDKVGHTASNIFFSVRPTCDPADTAVTDNVFFSYTNYDFAEDPACYDSIFDVFSYALTCRFLVLNANLTGCLPNDVDQITMSAGWACGPIQTLPDPGCIQDTTYFYFYQKESDLKATVEAPTDNVFQACEPAEYVLTVTSSSLGTMYNIVVDVVLPNGMLMVPDSSFFLYPADSTFRPIDDPDSLGLQTYRYVIDSIDSIILANGLVGVSDLIRNQFQIRFDVTTDCDYTSGSVLQFFVSGYTNCDSLITFAFQTDPQYVEGAEPEYAMLLQMNTLGFRGCSNTAEIEIIAFNEGPSAVTANDSVQVVIPAGFSYVPGSFVGINNSPTNPVPVTTAAPGGTLLSWELNAGMAPGSYSAFTIDIMAANALACEDIDIVLQTNFKDTVVCLLAQDSTCFLNGLSGQDTFAIPVIKDLYSLSDFEAEVGCSTTVVSITVHNEGPPTTANQTVEFYCDTDGSGTFTPGDVLIGTLSNGSSLPVNGSVTLSDTLNDYCESNIIAVMQNTNNCICSTIELSTVPTVDPDVDQADAEFTFIANCNTGTVSFTSAPNGPGAQHVWDFGDGNTSTAANPTHTYTGTPPFTVTHSVVDTCRTDTVVKQVDFDATAPAITCPADTTVDCTSDTSATQLGFATTDDTNATVTYQDSVVSGTCPVLEIIYREWTATDTCGNSTSCTQVITRTDTTAPTLTCPMNSVVSNDSGLCGATVSFAASASDDCDSVLLGYSHAPGSFFPVGTTTVTVTAADGCGNTTTCAFTVTVNDIEPPIARCQNTTVYLDNMGEGSVTTGDIDDGSSDNCGIASMSVDVSDVDCDDLGTQTVVLTVVDVDGNSSTCAATVTVEDTIAPTIACPADVAVNCVNQLPPPNSAQVSASDNCTVVSVVHGGDVVTGTGCAGNPRVVTRTYIATDQSGNTSSCTQTLTAEATPVVATASSNTYVFPLYQDSACAVISVTASGGCPPYTYLWSNGATTASQTVCPTVTTTYYVTVTDAQGCTDVDSVKVCVIDIRCVGNTNNGQGGNGQSGNGSTNGNGMVHIAVCHIPPGNPNNAMTKCLPIPAAFQHVSQVHGGDYLGPCGNLSSRSCNFSGMAKMLAPGDGSGTENPISMKVFPNPTFGNVNVEVACGGCERDGAYALTVVDMYGRQILLTEVEVILGAGSVKIDLSRCAAGAYRIVLQIDGQRFVEQVVKQ